MASNKPLGVFWDLSETLIPPTSSPNEWISYLREFISNQFNDWIEYEFICVTSNHSNPINDSIIQSLTRNGCRVFDSNFNPEIKELNYKIKVFIKLDQLIRRFVENYGFDTIVVLISNNPYLSSTIRLAQHREVTVLLIFDETFLQNQNQNIVSNDVLDSKTLEDNKSVILSITNIPNDKSRKTIRQSFMPFCQQMNCKYRFNRRDSLRLEFNNLNDAKRAQIQLQEIKFGGHKLDVRIIESEDKQNINSSSSVCSSMSSQTSGTPNRRATLLPQNDDKCKSVIIGLFTRFNQNCYKLVQKIVDEWNDSSVNDSLIFRVNRERHFMGRDGKASLIVTAIDRQSNNKLISMAKKHFVDKENKLYWNRLIRSKRSPVETVLCENSSNECIKSDFSNDCKSIITGLWTKYDDNVLKTVRNLVKNWNIYHFDIRHIIYVERSNKFDGRDGKAPLLVTIDSPENNKRILGYVSKLLEENNNKFKWEAFPTSDSIDRNQTILMHWSLRDIYL